MFDKCGNRNVDAKQLRATENATKLSENVDTYQAAFAKWCLVQLLYHDAKSVSNCDNLLFVPNGRTDKTRNHT